MGKLSREKGKRGEREFAALLRDYGIKARRGVQYHGGPNSPDVVGFKPFHIEVKRAERLDVYGALAQSTKDSAKGEIPIVAHRRNGMDWIVVMDFEDFMKVAGYAKDPYGQAHKGDEPGVPGDGVRK